MTTTPAQVLLDAQFEDRLAKLEARVPETLKIVDTHVSLAKRNQVRRQLYHDVEVLRIELEELMNEHEIEKEWLTAPEMIDANKKLDAVRKQLKLEVVPSSHSPFETVTMVLRFATFMWVLVGWFSAVSVIIPLRWLHPWLRSMGWPKHYLPLELVSTGTAKLLCLAAGTSPEAEGQENLTNAKDSVVCMFSHASNLDGFIVNGSSPIALRFAAKKSLFMLPFLGWGARWGFGFVAIDRSNRKMALKSLAELATAVNEEGASVCISPEGTRSKDGLLQEFKKGPFYLRDDTKKNVVPAIVFGAYELWAPGRLMSLPGHTLVRFLPEYVNDPAKNRNQNRLALRRIYLKAFTEDVPDHIGTAADINGAIKSLVTVYLIWALSFKTMSIAYSVISAVCSVLGIGLSTFSVLSLILVAGVEVLMFFTC